MSAAAAANRPERAPNAIVTLLTKPPAISSAQLSMSIARMRTASSVAASTNHPAEAPSADHVTPAMKNAATPDCAIASAAAFRTDKNGSSAVDDKTTRMGWRGGKDDDSGMG